MFCNFCTCPYCHSWRVILNTDIKTIMYNYKCLECQNVFNTLAR